MKMLKMRRNHRAGTFIDAGMSLTEVMTKTGDAVERYHAV